MIRFLKEPFGPAMSYKNITNAFNIDGQSTHPFTNSTAQNVAYGLRKEIPEVPKKRAKQLSVPESC